QVDERHPQLSAVRHVLAVDDYLRFVRSADDRENVEQPAHVAGAESRVISGRIPAEICRSACQFKRLRKLGIVEIGKHEGDGKRPLQGVNSIAELHHGRIAGLAEKRETRDSARAGRRLRGGDVASPYDDANCKWLRGAQRAAL